jgi:hypothetical protein
MVSRRETGSHRWFRIGDGRSLNSDSFENIAFYEYDFGTAGFTGSNWFPAGPQMTFRRPG